MNHYQKCSPPSNSVSFISPRLWWAESYWHCLVNCSRRFNLAHKNANAEVGPPGANKKWKVFVWVGWNFAGWWAMFFLFFGWFLWFVSLGWFVSCFGWFWLVVVCLLHISFLSTSSGAAGTLKANTLLKSMKISAFRKAQTLPRAHWLLGFLVVNEWHVWRICLYNITMVCSIL